MSNTTTIAFKSKITKAFKILRLMDYWCKQNHSCCNSCGWAEIPDDKRDKVAVFYHLQDNENLKDNKPILYLSWCGNHDEIIKVLSLVVLGIEATCGNPEGERIECLTGNPKTMASQIKPLLQSDSAIVTHLANAMLKKGSDDASATSGLLSTSNIYDATSGINTNAYANMLVSLAAFKNELKALPAFTGVADGDIRIVFTDCNKCVGYDTAKTNTKANAFAKLSATSAASINECHVNRVEFSLAETANNGIAVNTRWSSTINALEHRVVFALRDSHGRVSGLLGISKPAV